jgi:hypothetical protein
LVGAVAGTRDKSYEATSYGLRTVTDVRQQHILLSVGRSQQIGGGVEPKSSRDQCENDLRSPVHRYPPFCRAQALAEVMFAAAPTVAARINHRLNFSVFLFSTYANVIPLVSPVS